MLKVMMAAMMVMGSASIASASRGSSCPYQNANSLVPSASKSTTFVQQAEKTSNSVGNPTNGKRIR